jgi:hypothetical protein
MMRLHQERVRPITSGRTGVRFCLWSLPVLIVLAWLPSSADDAVPCSVVGSLLLDVGVAASSDRTSGTRNPAGLGWIAAERLSVVTLRYAASRESWDALRAHRDVPIEDGRPAVTETIHGLDSKRLSATAQLSILDFTRRGWAARGTLITFRDVVQQDASNIEYQIAHHNTAVLGVARGEDLSDFLGGRLSAGFGLDLVLRQDVRLDVSSALESDEAVRGDHYLQYVSEAWTQPWFSDFDPDFGFTTRIGGQWRRSNLFSNEVGIAVGVVLENLAASGTRYDRGTRMRGGVALVHDRSRWPVVAVDLGTFTDAEGRAVEGMGASAYWDARWFTVVGATRPDARAIGMSLEFLGIEFSAGIETRRDDAARKWSDPSVFTAGLALIPGLTEEKSR